MKNWKAIVLERISGYWNYMSNNQTDFEDSDSVSVAKIFKEWRVVPRDQQEAETSGWEHLMSEIQSWVFLGRREGARSQSNTVEPGEHLFHPGSILWRGNNYQTTWEG